MAAGTGAGTPLGEGKREREGDQDRKRGRERGAATAEFAVALPAIVLVLVGGLTGISAGVTQLRLEEAARAAAREIMRADPAAAEAAVERLAGTSAQLVLSEEGQWTAVEVRSVLSLPVLSLLPLELSADAVAFPGDGGLPDGIQPEG
ncbi:TadE family type IV pilus minor pilin [Arthrobacter zhaoxinii]|uniref:TadE family type IV pilus minor pilin n=1 Tax=Arthrobacter zhaoxinii TaxID=2964616 RepID=UPI002103C990|nr:TadE family type IV pilus minor pilin [Arthrobacter zhaoxinii]MCQ1999668.1 pilus assembly protein [Arthrobacter zhaoxinii]